MSTAKQRQYWEELGEIDPYWAILSDPKCRYGKWNVDDFFRSGEVDIRQVMEWATEHGYPAERDIALDFGCGVGRLTRALAKHFRQVYGIDISTTMLARARELNATHSNCRFELADNGLRNFPDNHYDMVYCLLVLQHVPVKAIVRHYISELVRVLKINGLLIFQLPHQIPPPYSLQPQRRVYAFLRQLGFTSRFLHHRLRLTPISNCYVPESEVFRWLTALGTKVLHVIPSKSRTVQDRIYYVTKV